MRVLLAIFVILFITAYAFAQDEFITNEEKMDRLNRVEKELAINPPDQQKAKLYYEKALLMFTTLDVEYSLSAVTNNLLKAIELDPDNKKYKAFLSAVYEEEWKQKNLSGDDEISQRLQALKDKVKSIVQEYNLSRD